MQGISHRLTTLHFFNQQNIALDEQKPVSVLESIDCKQKLTIFTNYEGYTLFMAILTIYSIFAIDINKAFFNQPAAYIFGYIHILAITIFIVEIIFNIKTKKQYLFSFYFWIDVVSTTSMALEITWVDNWLTDNSNLPGVLTIAKVVKASRLSRIGGRAAKILLMLFTYLRNKKIEQEQLKQQKNTQSVAGDSFSKTQTIIEQKMKSEMSADEQEDITEFNGEDHVRFQIKQELAPIQEQKISQDESSEGVNLKISENLVNLIKKKDFGLTPNNLFGAKRSKLIRPSEMMQSKLQRKTFQIKNIVERLETTFKLEPLVRINVDPQKAAKMQQRWQEICEKEEELKKKSKEKIKSNKENFKLGESLKQKIQKNIIIMIMSLIIILPLISADTWYDKDPTVDNMMQNYCDPGILSYMPKDLRHQYLSDLIVSTFQLTQPIMYLQCAIDNQIFVYPGNFSNIPSPSLPLTDYMQVQKIIFSNSNSLIIFNNRTVSQTSSIVNLVRSCFITILLIFSTIIFMYSIQQNTLVPLEKMCESINKISINPFQALKELNESNENKNEDQAQGDHKKIETEILQKAIWKMTNLLVTGAGQQGSQLISSKIDDNHQNSFHFIEGSKVHGIFMFIKLANYQKYCDSREIFTYVNKIYKQIHQIVIKNGGIILESDCPFMLLFWKTPDDLSMQYENTKFFTPNHLKDFGKTIETQKLIQLALRTYLQINISLCQLIKSRNQQDKDKSEQQCENYILQAGLHIGDAISGPIGSNLKLEVKCIGNEIEFTKKLCQLAGYYKVSNLMSSDICSILQYQQSYFIRKIDFIKQDQLGDSYWIYSHDFSLIPVLYPEKLQNSNKLKKNRRTKTKIKSINIKLKRNVIYKRRIQVLSRLKLQPFDSVMPQSYYERECYRIFSLKFYQSWDEAMERYYSCEWQEASTYFQSMNDFYWPNFNDQPSSMMLQRINMFQRQGIDASTWDKAYLIKLI